MLQVRKATDDDFDAIWPIFHEIVERGDTYAYPPDTDKAGGYKFWMEKPLATYVAVLDEQIVGTYYIKPNHPGLGDHVCNVGYMVGHRRAVGAWPAPCANIRRSKRESSGSGPCNSIWSSAPTKLRSSFGKKWVTR